MLAMLISAPWWSYFYPSTWELFGIKPCLVPTPLLHTELLQFALFLSSCLSPPQPLGAMTGVVFVHIMPQLWICQYIGKTSDHSFCCSSRKSGFVIHAENELTEKRGRRYLQVIGKEQTPVPYLCVKGSFKATLSSLLGTELIWRMVSAEWKWGKGGEVTLFIMKV